MSEQTDLQYLANWMGKTSFQGVMVSHKFGRLYVMTQRQLQVKVPDKKFMLDFQEIWGILGCLDEGMRWISLGIPRGHAFKSEFALYNFRVLLLLIWNKVRYLPNEDRVRFLEKVRTADWDGAANGTIKNKWREGNVEKVATILAKEKCPRKWINKYARPAGVPSLLP